MARKKDSESAPMLPTQGGELVIAETVLAEIAFLEAMSVPGIAPPREGFVRGVLRRGKPTGVAVEASANEVAFHLTVGAQEGACIPEAANELRRRVAAAVTAKTGYAVRAVNVLVDRIVFGKRP